MRIKRNNSTYVLLNTSYFKTLEEVAKRLYKQHREKFYTIIIEDLEFKITDIYILSEINKNYGIKNIEEFFNKYQLLI